MTRQNPTYWCFWQNHSIFQILLLNVRVVFGRVSVRQTAAALSHVLNDKHYDTDTQIVIVKIASLLWIIIYYYTGWNSGWGCEVARITPTRKELFCLHWKLHLTTCVFDLWGSISPLFKNMAELGGLMSKHDLQQCVLASVSRRLCSGLFTGAPAVNTITIASACSERSVLTSKSPSNVPEISVMLHQYTPAAPDHRRENLWVISNKQK